MLVTVGLMASLAQAGTASAVVGLMADRGGARHHLVPTAGARLQLQREGAPAGLAAELLWARRDVQGALYQHTRSSVRLAAGPSLRATPEARLSVDAWAGPMVLVRWAEVDGRSAVQLQPAVRAASGLGWSAGKRWWVRFQLGAAARIGAPVLWDFDGTFDLGVRW
ncbi:MAG: hypothetical protein KTR31_01860 [Myxococcales bacterium]|nr:hypothetical protein [Myxococcales bacterium]